MVGRVNWRITISRSPDFSGWTIPIDPVNRIDKWSIVVSKVDEQPENHQKCDFACRTLFQGKTHIENLSEIYWKCALPWNLWLKAQKLHGINNNLMWNASDSHCQFMFAWFSTWGCWKFSSHSGVFKSLDLGFSPTWESYSILWFKPSFSNASNSFIPHFETNPYHILYKVYIYIYNYIFYILYIYTQYPYVDLKAPFYSHDIFATHTKTFRWKSRNLGCPPWHFQLGASRCLSGLSGTAKREWVWVVGLEHMLQNEKI